MSMECFIGVDLGSTTTKAVVLNERGEVLGRGITNSRSNYDVAVQIAREEAIADVRHSVFNRRIEQSGALGSASVAFMEAMAVALRLEAYLAQVALLEEQCARDIESGKHHSESLKPCIRPLFDGMRADAEKTFVPGNKARSDFFRDLAGESYVEQANGLARDLGIPFERLMGLFDRNIITVENQSDTLGFPAKLRRACNRMEQSFPTSRHPSVAAAIEEAATMLINTVCTVGTGYGRVRLPFPKEHIRSEILCHGLGAHLMFPGTATVLDIGGQDTKAIQVDPDGVVTSFQMNDRCAAGCGRYLGYIADEMSIGLQELGPLALGAKRKIKINSTCTVFAGAEFRDRLAAGEAREDILGGLHRAIILRAMSLLARSGGVRSEFTFTGGVAKNLAAVKALRELLEENYGVITLNIAPESIFTGALGAAAFAIRSAAVPVGVTEAA